MITDPHSDCSFKQPSFESDSALFEVAFTTLYADVKEPAGPRNWVRGVWASEFTSSTQTENGRCLLLPPSDGTNVTYGTHRTYPAGALTMVGVAGFEPATLRLSSACSNQLSYTPAHC